MLFDLVFLLLNGDDEVQTNPLFAKAMAVATTNNSIQGSNQPPAGFGNLCEQTTPQTLNATPKTTRPLRMPTTESSSESGHEPPKNVW
ncbi:hypothetical protein Vi05172_g4741 [Venturia inaequalis]|nr:hypothetical protein Vi05172_g4741 [Venturia inaequalis]